MGGGVGGSAGRMGGMLLGQCGAMAGTGACGLAGAGARGGGPAIGKDAGLLAGVDPCGVRVSDDPVPLFAGADAVIDFTTPESTRRFSALAAQGKTVHVVGTTGLNEEEERALTLAEIGRASCRERVCQYV